MKSIWAAIFMLLVTVQPVICEKIGPVISLGPGISPQLEYDSNAKKFFVVWGGSIPFYGRFRGSFVNLNGTHSSVETYSTLLQESSPTSEQVLFDSTNDRFLLIWIEKNQDVFTRFIDSQGNASPINRIYNNDKGFGAFGIFSARHNQTGEYLIDVPAAYKFILDPEGLVLYKSGNIRFTDMKIFSAAGGSGYSVFGSFGGSLVFQVLDSQGRGVTDRRTILENGTWFPLLNDLTVAYQVQKKQYLLLYSDRQTLTVKSIRVNVQGKILGSSHLVEPNLVHQKEIVGLRNGYRGFFVDSNKGLYSRKLDPQGLPVGSVKFIFHSKDIFDVPSLFAVASTEDQKRHLVCWSDERSQIFCRFLYE